MTLPLNVRRLGRVPYETSWKAMSAFTDTRTDDTVDELWLLEHDPVFTLGQAGLDEHVLFAGDIPVVRVDRGGQVTYHGPGQIVAYPMMNLRRVGVSVRDGAPGVYTADAKVAALGLRVRRGCSFHGLAFNVNMDLEPFHRINPCGYKGLEVTQVVDLGGPSRLQDVEDVLVQEFCKQFGFHEVRSAPVIPELPARIAV